jgi:hypothetical protein
VTEVARWARSLARSTERPLHCQVFVELLLAFVTLKCRDAHVISDSMTPSGDTKLDATNFLINVSFTDWVMGEITAHNQSFRFDSAVSHRIHSLSAWLQFGTDLVHRRDNDFSCLLQGRYRSAFQLLVS